MALVSITMTTGATIGVGGGRNGGRAFAQNGAITLDTNTIIAPTGSCNAPAPTPKPTPRPTPDSSRRRSRPRLRPPRRPRVRHADPDPGADAGHAQADADPARVPASRCDPDARRHPGTGHRHHRDAARPSPSGDRRAGHDRQSRRRPSHDGPASTSRPGSTDPVTFDGGAVGIIGPFVVPGFLAAASGFLLILLMLAQALGALAWLPVVRRRVGSFGIRPGR